MARSNLRYFLKGKERSIRKTQWLADNTAYCVFCRGSLSYLFLSLSLSQCLFCLLLFCGKQTNQAEGAYARAPRHSARNAAFWAAPSVRATGVLPPFSSARPLWMRSLELVFESCAGTSLTLVCGPLM